jgi:Glycosyltransferase family 87
VTSPSLAQTGGASAALRRPHLILAGAAATALACEVGAQRTGSALWMVLAAVIVAAAFVLVWRSQDRLRLPALLALSLAFHVAWVALHLRLGLESFDSEVLYRRWGNELLDGRYPESQYPPGAVLLFAFDAWLGGGPTRTSNAFVMVPFQLLTVAAVWALRTRLTPWLAALVALWPMNAFFWEFRFDLVPTALLALGLFLAVRDRWTLSGAALGLGAAVKWVPGVAFAVLAVWLLASGRRRLLGTHVVAFAAVFILIHLPFLVWSPSEATFAYRYFGGQGITGESVWYLLLAPLGLATAELREFWLPADVPGWANSAAGAVQALVMLAVAVAAARARRSVRAGVAVAAIAPVLFFLTNRIFSPQYLVVMLAAWAIAGALLLESRREQLALGVAVMAATTANALVYPYTTFTLGLWRVASAILFALGLATTVWLVLRALRLSRAPAGSAGLLAGDRPLLAESPGDR